jgi:hypothetical protein
MDSGPHGPRSTPALISYALLINWTLTTGGVFALIALRIPVGDVMVGILGGILSTVSAAIAAVAGYWLAASAASTRRDHAPQPPPPGGQDPPP